MKRQWGGWFNGRCCLWSQWNSKGNIYWSQTARATPTQEQVISKELTLSMTQIWFKIIVTHSRMITEVRNAIESIFKDDSREGWYLIEEKTFEENLRTDQNHLIRCGSAQSDTKAKVRSLISMSHFCCRCLALIEFKSWNLKCVKNGCQTWFTVLVAVLRLNQTASRPGMRM